MEKIEFHICLRRIDRARNMARYYLAYCERDLFGDLLAVREWGRIGQGGKRLSRICQDNEEARRWLKETIDRKKRRGYGQSNAN